MFVNITHGDNSELAQGTVPIILDVSSQTPKCTRLASYNFWYTAYTPPYGNGGVVNGGDGYIYLYASVDSALYLARVALNLQSVSNLFAYQYVYRI